MTTEEVPTIFVKGLPQECTQAQIRKCFGEYGKVVDIMFKYGPDANRVKGIAFINFETQETVDKLIEEKFVTMDDVKLEIRKPKEVKGNNQDEPIISVPREALNCYVCKKDKFPSLRVFFNHKQGKQHRILLKMFRAKSVSVLQLLRAESKLASDRLYDMKWVKENPSKERPYCDVCQVQINYNPVRHEKSPEHKMVLSYINKKCCDIEFTNRIKYETHLLSLKHLKNAYEKKQRSILDKGEERLTMKKAIDIYKQSDQDLKELKEKYPDLDLNEELPPFDNQPIGLNHIVKKINYYCICCDQKFFANVNFVKPHCRSYSHYSNMVDFISEIEKENKKRRISEEREKKVVPKKEIENIEIKKREREEDKEGAEESASKKPKTDDKDGDVKKKDGDGNEEDDDTEDHHDEDFEMHEEAEDAENEEDEEEEEEEEEAYGQGDYEEEHEEEPEEEHEEEQEDEEHEEEQEQEEEEEEVEHGEEQEQEEEREEEQDEEQEQEMEEEESTAKEAENQEEEVGTESENQAEDDDDIKIIEQEEPQTTEEPQPDEENTGDAPAEETKEEEEEEVVEVPKPRATRGRRGRGRGRSLRR